MTQKVVSVVGRGLEGRQRCILIIYVLGLRIAIIKIVYPLSLSENHPLDARVVLRVRSAVGVSTPGAALVVEVGRERLDLADPLGRLQELDGETLVRVPCNVTVL